MLDIIRKMQKFPKWLEAQYLKWQNERGKRATLQDFGSFLGISRVSLSQYLAGKRIPDDKNLARIARRLGTQIYEVLGKDLDSQLLFILNSWDKLTSDQKEQLLKITQSHIEKKEEQSR